MQCIDNKRGQKGLKDSSSWIRRIRDIEKQGTLSKGSSENSRREFICALDIFVGRKSNSVVEDSAKATREGLE